ncbi:hypothetical protein IMX26_12630 [Clostridium sp. 'deep sea']|uniref:hypothetical protein n=1 Tax=Clostridium sp. 'deep sea' TaxID=2779445 RepID=UPI0018966C7B|nr:hypothetical protein [Clostridium sp. 'deep sea']QOR34329.1 hypothetical protein IMX26_12630 [Clostridium sp. 'deep sea']
MTTKKIVTIIGILLLTVSILVNAYGYYQLSSAKKAVSSLSFKLNAIKPHSNNLSESEEIYNLIDNFISYFNEQDFENIKKLWLNVEVKIEDEFIVFCKTSDSWEWMLRKNIFDYAHSLHYFSFNESESFLSLVSIGESSVGYLTFYLKRDSDNNWKIDFFETDI